MIGVMVPSEVLMAHQCQAMALFELGCVKSLRFSDLKLEPKLTHLSVMTLLIAAKQFHIMPMRPMIGVMVPSEVLMAHQCQAMAHFELGCVKSLRFSDVKLEQYQEFVTYHHHPPPPPPWCRRR